jgi:DNA polymerase III subunit delta'
MRFNQIVGQHDLASKLRIGVRNGRIPHAQLFLGSEGSGNLPLALAYAQYLLCDDRKEDDSCGVCGSCRKIETLTHPDVNFSFPFPSNKADVATELYPEWRAALLEDPYLNYESWMQKLDAASKQGNIPIKECHAILRNLSLKPFEADYKILIMWLPEFLGSEGNVLLKAIEEPSHKTIFLLVAENTEKLLTTILSRVQMVRVPPILAEDLAQWLISNRSLNEEDALRVSVMAAGDLLKASELAANSENHYLEPFRNWMGYCYQKKMPAAFQWVEDYSSNGREQLKGFFIYSLEILRAVLVYPVLGEKNNLSPKELEFVANFSKIINTQSKAESMYKWLNDAAYEIERNGNPKLILTDISFKLARLLK